MDHAGAHAGRAGERGSRDRRRFLLCETWTSELVRVIVDDDRQRLCRLTAGWSLGSGPSAFTVPPPPGMRMSGEKDSNLRSRSLRASPGPGTSWSERGRTPPDVDLFGSNGRALRRRFGLSVLTRDEA